MAGMWTRHCISATTRHVATQISHGISMTWIWPRPYISATVMKGLLVTPVQSSCLNDHNPIAIKDHVTTPTSPNYVTITGIQ